MIRAEFARHGFTPAAVRDHDQIFAVIAAVEAGQGWTLLNEDGRSLVTRTMKLIPIADFEFRLPHALIWRAEERRPTIFTVMEEITALVSSERAARDGREPLPDGPAAVEPCTPCEAAATPPSAVLEMRHLRYFCAVVEAGSFGRAAEQLGLTQPAISRQVADLERVVAVPLLERAARGVSTTPAGDAFSRRARRILEEVRSLPGQTQRARR